MAGLIWVGAAAGAMRTMGDKVAGATAMAAARGAGRAR